MALPSEVASRQLISRGFVFTWNNWSRHCPEVAATPAVAGPAIAARLEALPHFRCAVFQFEEGKSGTSHVQGDVEFKQPVAPNATRSVLPGAHVDKRRGSFAQSYDYCTKDDTRLPDTSVYTVGDCDAQRLSSRSGLQDAAAAVLAGRSLRAVAAEGPATYVRSYRGLAALRNHYLEGLTRSPPVVRLLHGPTGCGKSWAARWYAEDRGLGLFARPTDRGWFDGMDGEPLLLLDEFDRSQLTLATLLRCLDRYSFSVPVKGGYASMNAVKEIWITTNLHARDWYNWDNREGQYAALARRISEVYLYVEGIPKLCVSQTYFDSPGLSLVEFQYGPHVLVNAPRV